MFNLHPGPDQKSLQHPSPDASEFWNLVWIQFPNPPFQQRKHYENPTWKSTKQKHQPPHQDNNQQKKNQLPSKRGAWQKTGLWSKILDSLDVKLPRRSGVGSWGWMCPHRNATPRCHAKSSILQSHHRLKNQHFSAIKKGPLGFCWGFVGDEILQRVYRDYYKAIKRIPIKQPGFPLESKGSSVFFSRGGFMLGPLMWDVVFFKQQIDSWNGTPFFLKWWYPPNHPFL